MFSIVEQYLKILLPDPVSTYGGSAVNFTAEAPQKSRQPCDTRHMGTTAQHNKPTINCCTTCLYCLGTPIGGV